MGPSKGDQLSILSFSLHWLKAAQGAVARAREDSVLGEDRYADAMLAVVAMHSAALCICKAVPGSRSAQIVQAKCEDVKAIRDVFVHAEDYAVGRGKMQAERRQPVFVPGETRTSLHAVTPGSVIMSVQMTPAESWEPTDYSVDLDESLRIVAGAAAAALEEVDKGVPAPDWVITLSKPAPEPAPDPGMPRSETHTFYEPMAGRRFLED